MIRVGCCKDPSPGEEEDRDRNPNLAGIMDHSPCVASIKDHSPIVMEDRSIYVMTCPTRSGYGLSSLDDYGMATGRELLGSDHVL